jgi:acetyl esterase/lipase
MSIFHGHCGRVAAPTVPGHLRFRTVLAVPKGRTYNPPMSNNLPIVRRTFLGMGGAAAIGCSLSAFGLPAQTSSNAAAVKVEKDVVVGKGGDTDLHCDIYRPPAGTEKHMALVHFHGGGFAAGNKDSLAAKVTPITARGYVSIAAQYRLSGVAKWPSQIDDAKTHIRWARAHADSLGIDPKRIAIVGYSAGGHIALFTAGVAETELAACVAFYPQTDVRAMAQALMPPGSDEAAIVDASPLSHIKAGFPPTVIFHGLSDVTIPPENSEHLLQVLRDAGVPSELHTFAGVPHEFDTHPEFAEACAALTDFFLDREVLNPRTYPPFGAGRRPAAAPGPGPGQ